MFICEWGNNVSCFPYIFPVFSALVCVSFQKEQTGAACDSKLFRSVIMAVTHPTNELTLEWAGKDRKLNSFRSDIYIRPAGMNSGQLIHVCVDTCIVVMAGLTVTCVPPFLNSQINEMSTLSLNGGIHVTVKPVITTMQVSKCEGGWRMLIKV